jgi:hypothetical protein
MSPHSKFNVSSLTINPQKSREVDWELLPPEQNEKHTSLETPFRWLATIMDGLFRAPGTKYRFGLNPLIDFLPVVGDLGAAFVSFSVLLYALTRGLPKILLARMGLNLLINELVGVVPVLGSAFALWFRANKRNYDLLQRHIALPSRSHKRDWIFVGAILAVIFAAILTGLAVTVVALRAFADLLSRS